MMKRGPLAWDNARAEGVHWGGCRPLRLIVHHVNDDTNKLYANEVWQFLVLVRKLRLPFASDSDKDITMATELERRCFVEGWPLHRGQKLYHGWMHVFPEYRGRFPLSLRALHTWEALGGPAEGGPASRASVHVMCEQLARQGCVDAAFAAAVQLDGYMREQDWIQLRAEDVQVDWRKDACVVALLFGRRHRGESVKTGQEQGVKLESSLLSRLLAERVKDMEPEERIFNLTADVFRREWRQAAVALGMPWFPPPHCLRHTGPSEDASSGRRTLEDIRRRGRWTQPKSVQRYSKPHALVMHKARLTEKVKSRGEWLEDHFGEAMEKLVLASSAWSSALA